MLSRSWLSALKDPQVVWVNIMQTFAIGTLIGIVFLDQSYDQEGIFNINGAIFMVISCVSFVYQFSVMNVFCLELPVLLREHFNGTYRVEIYYITKQLADLPFYVILPIILTSIIYWMVGFNDDIERFLMFIIIIIILTQVVTGWGKYQ